MTCPVIKKVTCPNCGTEGDFIIYSTINVTLHPKLQREWRAANCSSGNAPNVATNTFAIILSSIMIWREASCNLCP